MSSDPEENVRECGSDQLTECIDMEAAFCFQVHIILSKIFDNVKKNECKRDVPESLVILFKIQLKRAEQKTLG